MKTTRSVHAILAAHASDSNARRWLVWGLAAVLTLAAPGAVSTSVASIVDLVYEFDGNSLGPPGFGTVTLEDNSGKVNFTIVANTTALNGGDIHRLYFNLPFSATGLAVVGSGGISSAGQIRPFSIIGPDVSVQGGAGASFDWGVDFGNGAGKAGNGLLTTATFTITADQNLVIDYFLTDRSASNNIPPVFMAVHFQNTGVFDTDSETVGGDSVHTPEPSTFVIWSLLGVLALTVGWRRRRAA